MMEFSTTAVAKVIGVSIRQVDHWARKGILRPSGRDAAGKGSRRRWRLPDVVALQAIRELRTGGCPLATIHKVVRHLMSHYPHHTSTDVLARLKLFAYGKRVLIVDNDDKVMDVLSRQTMFCLPIGNLIIETSRRVESMPQHWVETTLIAGKAFRIDVRRNGPGEDYVAHCRALRGAVARDRSADGAVANLKRIVVEVLALESAADRPSRRRSEPRTSTGASLRVS